MKHLGKRVLSMILVLGITTSMLVSDVSAMQVYAAGNTEYVDEETALELLSEESEGKSLAEVSSVEEVSESVEESSDESGEEPSGEIEDVEEEESSVAGSGESTETTSSVEESKDEGTSGTEAVTTEETTETVVEETTEELLTEEAAAEMLAEELTAEGVVSLFSSSKVNDGFILSADEEGKLQVEFTEPGKTRISGKVEIPSDVKIIPRDEKLFDGNLNVTEVTFAEGSELTTIEAQAFMTSSIKEIKIPATVTFIGERAFYSSDLQKVTLVASNGESQAGIAVGNRAFAKNSNLTKFTSNGRLASLGAEVFLENKELEGTVSLDGVTAIGAKAFYGCESLDYIRIPDSVTVIEESTFENCKTFGKADSDFYRGDRAVRLGDGVTEIKDSAFAGCSGLEELILPKKVEKLGHDVFSGCTSLKNIKIYNVSGTDSTSACNIDLTYTSFPNLKGLVLEAYDGTVEDWVGSHTSYGVTFKTLYESYNVKVASIQNGTVTTNAKTAKMGDIITVTVNPASGYVLEYESLFYTYEDGSDGSEPVLIDPWDYTFTMPSYEVTIHATFVPTANLKYGTELILADEDLYNKTNADIIYDEDEKELSFSKPWQSVRIQVTGDNGKIPVYSQLKFTTSNSKAVTVDEKGNIRAIAPTNGTNITVEFTDKNVLTKPLTFKVVVGEETFVENISFDYTASKAEVDLVSGGNGEASEIGYDIITYPSSLLNISARTIKIVPDGKDSSGDTLDISYQLTSNDAAIAKPKASKFVGEGTITIPKGALGETVVTVKAVDSSDEPAEKQFVVRIIDDTPRLADSTITVDPQSVTGTMLDLVSVYDASPNVNDLSIRKKVVSKGNTVYEETDDIFELDVEDGKVYLRTSKNADTEYKAGKNYTYKNTYYIHGTLEDSDTEFYVVIPTLTICKKNIKPTIKTSGKINLFYNGKASIDKLGSVTVTQNQKDLVVESCELIGNEKTNGVNTADDNAFAENFKVVLDEEKQTITIVRTPDDEQLSCYTDGKSKGKPVLNGMIRIKYEGYTEPFDIKITVPTQTTVPTYTLDTTKISLNSFASGQEYNVSFINKKTKTAEDLISGETEVSLDISDSGTTDGLIYEDLGEFTFNAESNTIHLKIQNAKNGKIVLILTQPEWEDQSSWNKKSVIKATITVTASSTFPTAKLGKSTLTLNAACPDAADYTTMTLNQLDSELVESQEFKASGRTQCNAIQVRYENGKVIAEITDSENVKKGTYSYTCYPEFKFKEGDTTDTAKAINVKVTVTNTLPSIKLKSSSFTLNANCRKQDTKEKYDFVTTSFNWVNLPAEYSDYILSTAKMDIQLKGQGTDYIGAGNVRFEMNESEKTAKIYLESSSKRTGSGSYIISGLKLVKDDTEIPINDITIKISSVDKTPTVMVSSKGTINPLDPASKIEYTPKLSNINGTVIGVKIRELDEDDSLLAEGSEHFTAEHNTSIGKTIVQVKEGQTLENRTYKIQLYYELSNGDGESNRVTGTYQVAKDQKITPKQTMPKISVATKNATFFAGDKSRMATIKVIKTSTATADINGIKFSSKTPLLLRNAFVIDGFNKNTGEMVLHLKNSAFIQQNKEQTLTFEIVCDGQLKDTTGTTFAVKVKVIK